MISFVFVKTGTRDRKFRRHKLLPGACTNFLTSFLRFLSWQFYWVVVNRNQSVIILMVGIFQGEFNDNVAIKSKCDDIFTTPGQKMKSRCEQLNHLISSPRQSSQLPVEWFPWRSINTLDTDWLGVFNFKTVGTLHPIETRPPSRLQNPRRHHRPSL